MIPTFQQTTSNSVTFTQLKDLYLCSDIITDIDLDSIEIPIDNELCNTSENPVQNSIITKCFYNLSGDIDILSENIEDLSISKLKITDVTDEISSSLSAPVSSRAIHELTSQFQDRITQLEYITNVKLAYTTNLEVFVTNVDIPAGTVSEKEARIDRLLVQTNNYSTSKTYPQGTIVTKYNTENKSLTQNVGIYKARYDIPAGTSLTATFYDQETGKDEAYWEDLTEKYLHIERDEDGNIKKYYHKFIESVPRETVQVLKFISIVPKDEQNIVIDWGDGSAKQSHSRNVEEKTETNNIELGPDHPSIVTKDENGYIYSFYHDYADSLITYDENGDIINVDDHKYYTITITGNKYSAITGGDTIKDENDNEIVVHNIISNIFGNNMQFYLNCVDIAGLLKNSKTILYVSCSDYDNVILHVHNIESLFEGCTNLQYVIGFYELTGINTMISMKRMFAGCKNLLNCDVRIAKSIAVNNKDEGNSEVYLDCEKLSVRLRQLLPSNGFDSRIVTLKSTFKNCKNIYMKNIDDTSFSETNEPRDNQHINDILFRDTSKIFYFDDNPPFEGCTLLNSILTDSTNKIYLVPNEWGNNK